MKQAIVMNKVNGVLIRATYAKINAPELSYESVCEHCQNSFLHSRKTARFCSDKCRKRNHLRSKAIQEAIIQRREMERRKLIKQQEIEEREKNESMERFIKFGNEIEKSLKIIRLMPKPKFK